MRSQTRLCDRAPRRVWFWLLCVLAVTTATLRGQEPAGASASDPIKSDPISLAADSAWTWAAGGDRWALLRGQAAVLQGPEGIRADEAVVRVIGLTNGDARGYRVEVYAEGHVRSSGRSGNAGGPLRAVLQTEKQVKLTPYEKNGLAQLEGRPVGVPILDRAFVQTDPKNGASVGQRQARTGRPQLVPAPSTARLAPSGGRPQLAGAPTAPLARPTTRPLQLVATSMPAPVAVVPASTSAYTPVAAPTQPANTNYSSRPVSAPRDKNLAPAQFQPGDTAIEPGPPGVGDLPTMQPPILEDAPVVPDLTPRAPAPSTELDPLPEDGAMPPGQKPRGRKPGSDEPEGPPTISVRPGTQRVTRIYARTGGPAYKIERLPDANGYMIYMIRGGVNMTSESPPPNGTVDISADSAVVWRPVDANAKPLGPNSETIEDAAAPMEVYLEGNVVFRQDTRMVAGNGDQKTLRAKKAYYDFRTGRFIALEAELNAFAPTLIAPMRLFSPRIDSFRPLTPGTNGGYIYGLEEIRADHTMVTGSRFPRPGYRFNSRSIDMKHVVSSKQNPETGASEGNPRDPKADKDLTWEFDARQNVYYLGPVPVFYWPRVQGEADDFEPPLQQFTYSFNNYFGQMILTDFNAFRLLGMRKPKWIDSWVVDLDYMSMRTKNFPALGTEIGWFGKDFLADLSDPYRKQEKYEDGTSPDGYYGYLDMWGLRDFGIDNLGSGPAIVTNNVILPDGIPAGKAGYQRNAVPPFQDFRGRINFRHMQSLLDTTADDYEDFRVQLEAAYVSDRYFIEEYYKRLNETGLDQETLGYMLRQKENWAWSIWAEANTQNFNTETQWLPKLDYYRLGDSLLGNRLTYFGHSGVDYAQTHTAIEVNNPNIFAFMPYDPISNTSGTLSTGRVYSNHEIDMPLNVGNMFRLVPYLQGQVVGWNNQIGDQSVGRVWGAAGLRANVMAWKRYPDVESDLLNVHGLNHKITLDADYRDAYSNVKLDTIGVQDDLDDNNYESVRRYFALTGYLGGVLPPQYDPRHLILRRTLSPITGTTDVQASIQTLQFGLHSRLQTKRGPEGKRRVIDFMTLDLTSTYFPYASRDNFGTPFGQNMYNWQWFLGDRTSLLSYGWFEFFDIGGQALNKVTNNVAGYPFGLNIITSGISISRPPRANVFIGYTVLNTGPLTTSALNPSISYWLSPKWYGTFSTSYDFGNAILLASMFSFTRVGADYLTTVGLTVDPQRQNYNQFSIAITPRISPGIRLGGGSGQNTFDSRYAATQ